MDTIKLQTPADLICFVPYLLGYEQIDRLVAVGVSPGMPWSSVQHPHTSEELLAVAAELGAAYRSHPGEVVLMAFTDEVDHALDAITAVTAMLDGVAAVNHALVVKSTGEWISTGGARGQITDDDKSKIAAEAALAGRPAPSPSRQAHSHRLDADPERVARVEEALTAIVTDALVGFRDDLDAWTSNMSRWARERVAMFTYDGRMLDDDDAARLIFAAQHGPSREAILADLDRVAARHQHPLWCDLMRRSPRRHLGGVAVLTAVTAWLSGDGATGRHALDSLTADEAREPLAEYVHDAVTTPKHPDTWTGWPVEEE